MGNPAKDLSILREKAYKKKKGMPWYGVNVTHRISIRVVRLIKDCDIEPDHITLLSIILGIVASCLFMIPRVLTYFLGALFLESYYVLDAVDGQYARLKEKTSVTGAYFDYISNHIVQSLVFIGMGIGLFRFEGNPMFMVAGFFAAWGIGFMYAIHDAKSSVLLYRGIIPEAAKNGEYSEENDASLPKKLFMILHKTGTFPTAMNIITVLAIITIIVNKGLILFESAVIYYAIVTNVIWMAKLYKLIKGKMLG